jgi:hypothetical protein
MGTGTGTSRGFDGFLGLGSLADSTCDLSLPFGCLSNLIFSRNFGGRVAYRIASLTFAKLNF